MTSVYDVVIVGAGVTGTALIRALTRYSTVRSIALVEKLGLVGQVNSNASNNAQTSHDGSTETNHSLAHALEIQRAATMLRSYVVARNAPGLFRRTQRMVLGVGVDEVEVLLRRFIEFSPHYPDISLIGADELWGIEPNIMKGREPTEPVAAIISTEGFAINYQILAECFLEDAQEANPTLEVFFNTSVSKVEQHNNHIELTTNNGLICAKVVVFAAGAYSLHFAHQMGYAEEYALLSVAGNFYGAHHSVLGNKIYRVQEDGLPFAAVHGDPSVLDAELTRFGPTTRPVFLMERHNLKSAVDFFRIGWISIRGLTSALKILSDGRISGYVLKQLLYSVPFLGTWLFLRKEVRNIVPLLRYRDLKLLRGAGGIRPQLVNLNTGTLEMGDKTFVGDNVIFDTTPSPGASVCIANAKRDAEEVVRMLGAKHMFNSEAFEHDHGLAETEAVA